MKLLRKPNLNFVRAGEPWRPGLRLVGVGDGVFYTDGTPDVGGEYGPVLGEVPDGYRFIGYCFVVDGSHPVLVAAEGMLRYAVRPEDVHPVSQAPDDAAVVLPVSGLTLDDYVSMAPKLGRHWVEVGFGALKSVFAMPDIDAEALSLLSVFRLSWGGDSIFVSVGGFNDTRPWVRLDDLPPREAFSTCEVSHVDSGRVYFDRIAVADVSAFFRLTFPVDVPRIVGAIYSASAEPADAVYRVDADSAPHIFADSYSFDARPGGIHVAGVKRVAEPVVAEVVYFRSSGEPVILCEGKHVLEQKVIRAVDAARKFFISPEIEARPLVVLGESHRRRGNFYIASAIGGCPLRAGVRSCHATRRKSLVGKYGDALPKNWRHLSDAEVADAVRLQEVKALKWRTLFSSSAERRRKIGLPVETFLDGSSYCPPASIEQILSCTSLVDGLEEITHDELKALFFDLLANDHLRDRVLAELIMR